MSEPAAAAANIFDRLTNSPCFHPAHADLFTDWNLQAGDIVTVRSGSESYAVPVHSMKLKWSGAPRVTVEATGNPGHICCMGTQLCVGSLAALQHGSTLTKMLGCNSLIVVFSNCSPMPLA